MRLKRILLVLSMAILSNVAFGQKQIYIDSAIRLSEMSENEAFKAKCLNKKGIIYYKQSDCTYSNQVYQLKFVVVN